MTWVKVQNPQTDTAQYTATTTTIAAPELQCAPLCSPSFFFHRGPVTLSTTYYEAEVGRCNGQADILGLRQLVDDVT